MSSTAKLKLDIDVVTYGDYDVASEIASEMLSLIMKYHTGLSSNYGYTVVRRATVEDGESVV